MRIRLSNLSFGLLNDVVIGGKKRLKPGESNGKGTTRLTARDKVLALSLGGPDTVSLRKNPTE